MFNCYIYIYIGESIGVNEFESTEFNIFDNPTNNVWNIKAIKVLSYFKYLILMGN